MSRIKQLAGSRVLWTAVVLLLFAVPLVRAMSRRPAAPPPVLYPLPEFRFTDETGRPFGSAELAGKVYIANFIFTTCGDVCPRLSRKMAALQKRIRRASGALMLVSFSVDPARDTPEVLQRYARHYKASPRHWKFLTGPLPAIERAVVAGFKLPLSRPQGGKATAAGFFDIVHSDRLVLVDGQGRIRGYYEATPEGMDAVLRDAQAVLAHPGTPASS